MTRNRASAKTAGTRFETAIATALAAALDDDRIERRSRNGNRDRGDIAGLRIHGQRVVLETKDCTVPRLPEWIREAHIEAGNDSAICGVVVSKRRGISDPLSQYVHMELRDLVALITGQFQDGRYE